MNHKKRAALARARKRRAQKNIIHGLLLAALAWTLAHEGAKLADGLFFALSIACEIWP